MTSGLNPNEILNKNLHLQFIAELSKSSKKMGLAMVYDGVVDQTVIRFMAKTMEEGMATENESFKTQKLLFHIMVELLQNISKYSDDEKKGKGIIVLGKLPEKYNVSSGNVVKNSRVKYLTELIENINNKDGSELQKLYDSKISNHAFNEQGGGGLGLIDIVRKSKQKLEFTFEPLSDTTSFFLVTITVLK